MQPVRDTTLDAPCLLLRLTGGNKRKEALTARIRRLRAWRHEASLSLLDVCPDGNDLLVIFDAPESLAPIRAPLHYRVVLEAVAAPIRACASLHSHGLPIGHFTASDLVESQNGQWLLIPSIEADADNDDLKTTGLFLHELLTGSRSPLSRHLNDHPESLVDGRPLPPMVDQLIASLLHPDSSAKPPGLAEVAEQLSTASSMSVTSAPILPRTAAASEPATPVRLNTQTSESRPFPWGWAFLGLIIAAVAISVVLFRPRPPEAVPIEPPTITRPDLVAPTPVVAEEPAEPIPEITPEPEPTVPEAPKIDPQVKAAAQAALEAVLTAIAQAEAVNAPDWAPNRWAKLLEKLQFADGYHKRELFNRSAQAHTEAAELATAIYESRHDAIPILLAAGTTALATGNQTGAIKTFTTALAIDPANLEAGAGLKRARVLDKVNENLARGAELEAQNLFGGARLAYFAAFKLDPLAPGAKEAIARLDIAIAEEAFLLAIDTARQHSTNGQLDLASDSVQKALDLLPGHPDAIKLQAEIELLKRKAAALEKINVAKIAESAENWQQAHGAYQEAIALDPTALDAKKGINRSAKRHELAMRTQKYVANPDILLDANLRRNANLLVAEIKGIPATEVPKLHKTAEMLVTAIENLSAPIAVTVESDGNTTVSILKVKRLGTITRRSLELSPGRYVAHGRRLGFQDVRVTFEVKPGAPVPILTIVCTTPIQ